ncbi:Lipase_3 domain-containing protein [Cephalotus follicularis]|uniref:Lipase_3 domain-containing protein n=1 Tax=Cephalotus follicularis TaxID=3775 RepID=A0A1Q3BSA2_CEPFO|nr:Lipase_3 domain-containing protein [Cephalotus follicularis]
MEFIQSRVESWIKDQRAKILKVSWGPLQWRMKWPPWNKNDREERKRIHEEYEKRKKQLHDLCVSVKAESVSDLQDILCSMVLSECVYKKPATDLIRAVNKYKADFGGRIVYLERVQPSGDHVPHRYLLAEAGDTLFASFIGTKQYKDIVADVNILQGAIFHDDSVEDADKIEATESYMNEGQKGNGEDRLNTSASKSKQIKDKLKPAVHRGFLGRANGIPALELYRLAEKKKRKLVLCGHSLGGAVAALATLAILRVIAASSSLRENEKVQVKCITFSQPPVGNAALRDYVNRKGWQHYFKTYCIPEDLVPRILSPAYFQHYNEQLLSFPYGIGNTSLSMSNREEWAEKSRSEKLKENEGDRLVLGVGPLQNSLWRLSRLVPIEGLRRQYDKYRGKHVDPVATSSVTDSTATSMDDVVLEPQSLEIQEGSDGISLKPVSDSDNGSEDVASNGRLEEKGNNGGGDGRRWRRVPYLPSYVPFGQLYLLENSSVESLSGPEYSKLTSVRSVFSEVRERFHNHSMKSYRSRFQRIYDLCMSDNALPFSVMEQFQQFQHLQQWLGLSVAGTVELGHIVESPVIRTATSIVPLGWSGIPGVKNTDQLKVDITGFGLHLCTLVHAQVNGNWCSTTVESFPSAPTYTSNNEVQPELQKIRVVVGAPLKRPPKHQIGADSLTPIFPSNNGDNINPNTESSLRSSYEERSVRPEGLNGFVIFCTSDFATVSKEVHVRTRRVRLLGLEGAGKTSLFKAILHQGRLTTITNADNLCIESDVQEGIAGGLYYSDSAGVNLQELNLEASRFRDELWMGLRDLSKKTDIIILVHNLSHRIPRYNHPNAQQQNPAVSLLLDEAKSLGIPWVLAITNKFSVSAHQQKAAIDAVLQAYQAPPSTTEVVNSCPYVMPSAANASLQWGSADGGSDGKIVPQNLFFAPINFVRRPFQKKDTILPVDGVTSLCQLVHRVLQSHEEPSFEELARDRLMVELAVERSMSLNTNQDSQAKVSSMTAATVGASIGAGLGIVLAVVMGAASALRKP